MDAIVYISNTGFTAHYSQLLGESTGLPVYELAQAKTALNKGAKIIYLGWLMAGQIKGYQQASRRYQVEAVCAVGMVQSYNEKTEHDIRKRYRLSPDFPVFVLQGGFQMEKLHGVYHFMMSAMMHTVGKKLESIETKTPEEAEMLDLLLHGADCVSRDKLDPVLEWLERSGL